MLLDELYLIQLPFMHGTKRKLLVLRGGTSKRHCPLGLKDQLHFTNGNTKKKKKNR
jgi:hypothetical protein